jgi:hypothetical protein
MQPKADVAGSGASERDRRSAFRQQPGKPQEDRVVKRERGIAGATLASIGTSTANQAERAVMMAPSFSIWPLFNARLGWALRGFALWIVEGSLTMACALPLPTTQTLQADEKEGEVPPTH